MAMGLSVCSDAHRRDRGCPHALVQVETLVVSDRSGRRPMLKAAAAAVGALALLGLSQPAAAWSEPAHRVIADIAYARLTPEARAQITRLIAEAPTSGEPS